MTAADGRERKARVAIVSAEVAPLAKVGGLADVAGSLPLALARSGVEVAVVMPHYGGIDPARQAVDETGQTVVVRLGDRTETFTVAHAWLGGLVPVYLLGNERLFGDPRIYIDPLDRERFCFFSCAVLEALPAVGFVPDVLHANDWHTGMALVWLRAMRGGTGPWAGSGAMLTIHNLAHQGITDVDYARRLGLDADHLLAVEQARYPGTVNVLARAIEAADAITTVSPCYAQEIQTPELGAGLDPLLRDRAGVLRGVLNGIDEWVFDPATDAEISERYTADDLRGKAICKRRLQEEAGLAVEPDRPLIGMVSRLDDQKGLDLVAAVIDRILDSGAQLVLLGTGDPRYEAFFAELGRRRSGQAGVFIAFDGGRAQRVYAGSDFFLMPSRFEPCGLGQMIAMRYGSIPIVRRTGGLADTVQEWDADTGAGTGFLFDDYDAGAMLDAVSRALAVYRAPAQRLAVAQGGMIQDWSWAASAREYLRIYEAVSSVAYS